MRGGYGNVKIVVDEFPSEVVSANGKGLTLRYGFGHSPFGDYLAATTDGAVCFMAFTDKSEAEAVADLKDFWWKDATFVTDSNLGKELSVIFFEPSEKQRVVNVMVAGSSLRVKVWQQIARVPFGQTISYSELALWAGNELAVRAVATSVGINPVWYIIPCHRIVRKDGSIGEYTGGAERKKNILEWEVALPLLLDKKAEKFAAACTTTHCN